MLQLARDASPRAIGRLIELMESDNGREAIAAANAVLDRAFGKPTQPLAGDPDRPPIGVQTEPGPMTEAIAKLSAKDRAALRTILGRVTGRPKGDS